MEMNFALMIYTVVAMSGSNASLVQAHDWRHLASFYTQERCVEAAKAMGISSERYRCVPVAIR
jgi:hypothetical protein